MTRLYAGLLHVVVVVVVAAAAAVVSCWDVASSLLLRGKDKRIIQTRQSVRSSS